MKKMPATEKKFNPRRSFKIREAEQSSGERKNKRKQSRAEVSAPKFPLRPLEMFMKDLKKEFRHNPSVNYDELAAEEWKLMHESGRAQYEEMWKMNKEEYNQAMVKYIAKMSENGDTENEEESEKPGTDTSGNESDK